MRVVIRLVAIVLVLVLLIGVAAALFLDRGARIAVEKGVSYALAVPTTAGSVSLRPMQGSVKLSELSVANPQGFSTSPFLDLDEATMSVKLSSLMEDVVEVPSLKLSGIKLHLEGRGTKTNYATILDNLKRLGTPADPNKPPDPEEQGTQKRFIVHDLLIVNTTVEVDYSLDSPLGNLAESKSSVNLPEIHITEVGNGKSLSLAELSAQILQALLEAAASGNVPGFSGDLAKDLERSLSGLKSKAKDLEDSLKSGTVPEDLGGKLEDLFKKKP